MKAPYVEQDSNTVVTSILRLLFAANTNTQYEPLQRLVSFRLAKLHHKLHQTGDLIPINLAIVRVLTYLALIHFCMPCRLVHMNMELQVSVLYVTYTFATIDSNNDLEEISSVQRLLALQCRNYGNVRNILIKFRYVFGKTHHTFI